MAHAAVRTGDACLDARLDSLHDPCERCGVGQQESVCCFRPASLTTSPTNQSSYPKAVGCQSAREWGSFATSVQAEAFRELTTCSNHGVFAALTAACSLACRLSAKGSKLWSPINRALVHLAGSGIVGRSSFSGSSIPMSHKYNADRRHHIPKMSFKVQNWPAYEAGLRRGRPRPERGPIPAHPQPRCRQRPGLPNKLLIGLHNFDPLALSRHAREQAAVNAANTP